ncbi:MAG: hypothetical protein J6A69_05770 [Clostridia bacterium]|nr:hypothetical protein [Clostridia bacterium]
MFKVLNFKNALVVTIVIMLAGVMTIFPSACVSGAKEGLYLSLFTVFPSVFPFMVLSRYITLSGIISIRGKFADKISRFLFSMPSEALMPFILGTVSGYPTGAAVICDMVDKKIITTDEGEHLLPFCNNCSPLFIIGTVGSVIIKNTSVGYTLFIIHITSAILTGMILKRHTPYSLCRSDTYVIPKTLNAFTTAVSSSVSAMMNICGYITLFSVITKIITLADERYGFLCGFLEMTNGITNIVSFNIPVSLKLAVISFFMGFSGICVLLQIWDFTAKRKMSMRKYFTGKLISGIISFVITLAVFSSNETVSVFNPCVQNNSSMLSAFSVVLLLLTILMLSLKNRLN